MKDSSNLIRQQHSTTNAPRLAVATGSYMVLASGHEPSDDSPENANVYPSYGIARVEAHLQTLQTIEALTARRLALPYHRELCLARQRCADDMEAWGLHGFMGEIEPMFSASTQAIHPKILRRTAIGASRYLLEDETSSTTPVFNALYDELVSEYVRTNLPGLWHGVTDARELLDNWLHGKAIRALAARYPEFHHQAIEVAVPQHQCSRTSIASVSGKIKQLLNWYVGANEYVLSQNFTGKDDWRQLTMSSEILPGVDSNKLWDEANQLLAAANFSRGIDCERRVEREKLQQAALHWAQWGLWSRQEMPSQLA